MKHSCPHINRPIFSKGRCKACALPIYMATAMANKKKRKDKNQTKKATPTRATLYRIYKEVSASIKQEGRKCEGGIPGCTHLATEIHHKEGRRGLRLIMSVYFAHLCHNCHEFCTTNSKEAKDLGLSLPINSITKYEFTTLEHALLEKYSIKMPAQYSIV